MSDTIQTLTATLRGRVITASHSDYDDARAVYNGMHDRKPRAIIECVDSADVMAAVAASTWQFVVGATAFPDSARWTMAWLSTCRGSPTCGST